MPDPVGVFLIDDSESMRELTRVLIEQDDRFVVVGDAEDLESSLEPLARLEVGVILLDFSLPDVDGFDAIPTLRSKAPDAAILLYTGHVFPGLEQGAIRHGAQGVIEKAGSSAEMRDAIASAAEDPGEAAG